MASWTTRDLVESVTLVHLIQDADGASEGGVTSPGTAPTTLRSGPLKYPRCLLCCEDDSSLGRTLLCRSPDKGEKMLLDQGALLWDSLMPDAMSLWDAHRGRKLC